MHFCREKGPGQDLSKDKRKIIQKNNNKKASTISTKKDPKDSSSPKMFPKVGQKNLQQVVSSFRPWSPNKKNPNRKTETDLQFSLGPKAQGPQWLLLPWLPLGKHVWGMDWSMSVGYPSNTAKTAKIQQVVGPFFLVKHHLLWFPTANSQNYIRNQPGKVESTRKGGINQER